MGDSPPEAQSWHVEDQDKGPEAALRLQTILFQLSTGTRSWHPWSLGWVGRARVLAENTALMAGRSAADANPFLQSVHRCMTSRLLQLPDKHSVTALLNTWAQSIHQACLSAA